VTAVDGGNFHLGYWETHHSVGGGFFGGINGHLLSAVFPRIVSCELEDAGGRFNWF